MPQRPRNPIPRTAADVLLLLAIAALLIFPFFRVEYFDDWMSIDGGFISDAQYLDTHGPGWETEYYCGNRLAYLYPPAIRYGTVALARAFGMSIANAYHFYAAILYCLSALGVYALVRTASASRRAAFGAAVASLLLSPVLVIFGRLRTDSAGHMPQHLNIIVKWGENAHMAAMSVLLFALAAGWLALRGGRPRMLALSAAMCALSVSFNFYGATALAILFGLMVWAAWATEMDGKVWLRAAAIGALAYTLTAWWLTPSFLALTVRNLKLVAGPSNPAWRLAMLALVIAFAAVTKLFSRLRGWSAWPLFLVGVTTLFGLNAIGDYFFHLQAIGDAHRFVPEFDLLLIIAAVECVRRRHWPLRVGGAVVLAASVVVAVPYLRHPWNVFVSDRHPQQRIEHRLSDWFAANLPARRVFTAGSFSFWAGAWHDIPQVGGISDQGMENLTISLANWQVLNSENAPRDIDWLQAMGADAVVTHGNRSQEVYHSIKFPGQFAGKLPLLFDSGQDDRIYAVPRRYPDLARVVDLHRLASMPPVPAINENEPALRDYVDAIEHGPDVRASVTWPDSRTIRIHADISGGQALLVQETYDPAWHAFTDGREAPIRADPVGMMLIDAPPGAREIILRFETGIERWLGRALSLLGWLIVAACFISSKAAT